jgi:hypothetical protein
MTSRASISAYSAKPPAQRPMTRSPGRKPSTPAPSSTTSPAASPPPIRASGAGRPGWSRRPFSRRSSARLIDEAWTRTRT